MFATVSFIYFQPLSLDSDQIPCSLCLCIFTREVCERCVAQINIYDAHPTSRNVKICSEEGGR